jgi:hypothetical protein
MSKKNKMDWKKIQHPVKTTKVQIFTSLGSKT